MEDTGYAAPTAATDGRHVFALFASGRVAAFDLDGEQVWLRSFGPFENTYGHSSSLALFEDHVLLQLDQGYVDDKLARLVALDATTGKTVWETPRPVDSSWASPIVVPSTVGPQVVLSATPIAAAYDPATGAEIWRADVLYGEVAPTPIYRDGVVYVVHEDVGLFAVRTDGTGDVTKTHVSWNAPDGAPDVTSPLCDGERVYMLTTSGTLTCVRASSGEVVWEHELEADYYASPVAGRTRSLPDEHGGRDDDPRRRRHVHGARHQSPRRGRLREHGVRSRPDLPAREGPPLRDRRSEIEPTSIDLRIVDRVVEQTGRTRSAVIPILQGLQAELRYLPEDALRRVCEITEITPADIVGVATFYDQFRFEPMGRNVLRVCHGTACHVKGSRVLQNAIDDHLGIPEGRDTDPDGARPGRVAPFGDAQVIVDRVLEDTGSIDVARRSVADAQDVSPHGLEAELVVERRDADDVRRRDLGDLADAPERVLREVTQLGLQSLQDRDDGTSRAPRLFDDAIDDAEVGRRGLYLASPIAKRWSFPRR